MLDVGAKPAVGTIRLTYELLYLYSHLDLLLVIIMAFLIINNVFVKCLAKI